ncbi:MAG: DUF6159 family protein [Phototrophicales bacterium]
MFKSFSNGWQLVKASYNVLKQDKELMIFPLLSTIAVIAVTIVMMIPLSAMGIFESTETATTASQASSSGPNGFVLFLLAFLFYFIMYTIVIFCNTALVGAAMIRLDGGDPTVQDGFRIASERVGAIIGYAAIAATVGMILQGLQNAARESDNMAVAIIGSIFTGLLEVAWNLITFLVVPVLVMERVGPIDAIKRSGSLLKQTWGENIAASFSMGVIQFLVMLLIGIVVGVPMIMLASSAGGVVAFLAIAVLVVLLGFVALFFATLNGIFQAALYKWATAETPEEKHQVGVFFDESMIRNAFVHK